MTPLFRIPIRLQLILIVAIVALPAAGIIIQTGIQQKNRAVNEAVMDTQRLVDRIASEQRIMIASTRQLVVSLSQLPEVKEKDAAKANTFLSHILKLHPNFSNIFIADSTGALWASAVPFSSRIKIDDRRFFKNALASGLLSSGEFQVGRVINKPTLNLGYPYKNTAGMSAGVIGAGIALDDYRSLLARTQLPGKAVVALIDYKGLILLSSDAPHENIGQQMNPALFKKMLNGPDSASSIDFSIDGGAERQYRYVSYQKLHIEGEGLPYMYIRVGIPVDSVLLQARSQMVRSLSLFTIVLTLALLIAWYAGKCSIADRITLLEQASKRLAAGDHQVRVSDLMVGGELRQLGESFDSMARQLAYREESLSESQRFLNTIIDTEPDCVKLLDASGRVLMMNPAGLEIVGVDSIDQIKGQLIFPRIASEFRDAFKKLTRDVFQGQSGRLEFEADNLKGKHLWLDTNVVPFRNDQGQIVSLLGITRDISDRKLAEKALAESESAFRATFEQAAVGMARVAPDGSWLEVNRRLCDILGYTRDELLAMTYQDIMHPDDLDSDLGYVRQVLVGEIDTYSKEMRFFPKDQSIIWVNFTVGAVRDSAGAPAYSISVVEDITKRKRAEEQLAEKQHLLEELNLSLSKRVNDAVSELRRKDQILIAQGRLAAMGEMIGNIAHQWRQPLNTLALAVQELKLTYPHDDLYKGSLHANVAKAMCLIQHMSKTIDDFSSYFKPDKEKVLFNANQAVAKALALVESGLANLDIAVEVSEKNEAFINGYANEYAQVLLNILLNCRDAFEGSKVAHRVINVTVAKDQDKSVVTVSDNAGGIPEDILDKIFDPYFTTKGPDKGTGIGLYMAKTIIEKNMGGTLSVRNTPEGAEFRIEV